MFLNKLVSCLDAAALSALEEMNNLQAHDGLEKVGLSTQSQSSIRGRLHVVGSKALTLSRVSYSVLWKEI